MCRYKLAKYWQNFTETYLTLSKNIAKSFRGLLQFDSHCSVIKGQCQKKTGKKEMFQDVDGRRTEKKMLGSWMAVNSKGCSNWTFPSTDLL